MLTIYTYLPEGYIFYKHFRSLYINKCIERKKKTKITTAYPESVVLESIFGISDIRRTMYRRIRFWNSNTTAAITYARRLNDEGVHTQTHFERNWMSAMARPRTACVAGNFRFQRSHGPNVYAPEADIRNKRLYATDTGTRS